MKRLTYKEACERVEEGKIVIAIFDYEDEDDFEHENILTLSDLENHKDDDEVTFGYDDVAEKEAEEIFASLRDEVKDYLHRLLVNENMPSW